MARRKSEAERQFDVEVEEAVHRIKTLDEAKRRVRAEMGGDTTFQLPEPGRTLSDDLAVPSRDRKYTIDQLHTAGGNTLLVAQYKAGKTTLEINLVKALADQEPFLGMFEVEKLVGRVGFFNYEMRADQFRDWMRDRGIEHPERVAEPLHLRGWSLPFWEPEYAGLVADWLKRNEVQFLIVDTAAAAWRVLVESENDNSQVALFTHHLDVLKREGGVDDLLLAHHTGRARQGEDEERGRGATRMDHGWYFSKDGDQRTLRAIGRDVEVEALDVAYDPGPRMVRATGQTRNERRESDGIQNVVDALGQFGDPPATSELESKMSGEKAKRNGWIRAAEAEGFIARTKDGKKLVCSVTEKGRKLMSRRVSLSERRAAG